MKFSALKSTFIVGTLAVIGAAADPTYRLIAEPEQFLNTNFQQISWVNQGIDNLFAGDVKFLRTAEPFVVTISSDGGVGFLSYHGEHYETLYVLGNMASPAKVDAWQMIPRNATRTGFTIDDDGYFGHADDKWALCPVTAGARSYQLYFVPDGTSTNLNQTCIATKLKAEAFGVCS